MAKQDTINKAREAGLDIPDDTDLTEKEIQEQIDAATVQRDDSEIPGVADADANDELEHSMGGQTTRSDATDVGVPMLQGDGSEPVGPEDAFGDGPKRGFYGQSAEDGSVHLTVTPDGVQHQNPKASDHGEVPGEKGGVTTG